MATFHFLRPEWLWGLLPLVGLLVLLAKRGANAHVWESVCDAHLIPHVLVGTTGAKSRSPIILLGLSWTLGLVALAGPVWSQLPQPVFRAESALVIVLDVSRSMDAQDVAPSRLTRAKHKILDILQARQEGQTALVIFAGESFVVSPLTDDARTMKTLVQLLHAKPGTIWPEVDYSSRPLLREAHCLPCVMNYPGMSGSSIGRSGPV